MDDRPRIRTRHPGIAYRLKADGTRQYMYWFTGTDGKPHWKNVPGGEGDAVKARARVVDRMAHGYKVAPTKTKVDSYADDWLKDFQPKAPRTKELAEWAVEKHIKRLLGHHRVADLDVHKIAVYIATMQAEGKKAWTIRGTLTPLRHICRKAVRDGLLPANPIDSLERSERPKSDQRKFEILDSDEITVFLSAATKTYKTLLATALFTGLRISEVCNLRWEDIDWRNDVLRVRKSKTKAGEREVVLMASLKKMLAQHKLEQSQGAVFVFETRDGRQMQRRTVLRRGMQDTLRRAKIEKKLRFHDLRHTYASILISQGHPLTFIAEQMGHTSPVTTQRIYGHLFDRDKQRDAAREKMQEAFGGMLGG